MTKHPQITFNLYDASHKCDVPTEGWQVGALVVHRQYKGDGRFYARKWCVSHTETGFRLQDDFETKSDAFMLAVFAEPGDWTVKTELDQWGGKVTAKDQFGDEWYERGRKISAKAKEIRDARARSKLLRRQHQRRNMFVTQAVGRRLGFCRVGMRDMASLLGVELDAMLTPQEFWTKVETGARNNMWEDASSSSYKYIYEGELTQLANWFGYTTVDEAIEGFKQPWAVN